VLAFEKKLREPRLGVRGCVGVRHAHDVEAQGARLIDERSLERSRI
jgi:hypothetical protein